MAATEKAVDLMSMAVARARHLKALPTGQLPVTPSALVIGGGLAGMTAALAIADQGFEVHLVEKEPQLGGNLRHVHSTLEGADVQALSQPSWWPRVQSHPKITRLPERHARRRSPATSATSRAVLERRPGSEKPHQPRRDDRRHRRRRSDRPSCTSTARTRT